MNNSNELECICYNCNTKIKVNLNSALTYCDACGKLNYIHSNDNNLHVELRKHYTHKSGELYSIECCFSCGGPFVARKNDKVVQCEFCGKRNFIHVNKDTKYIESGKEYIHTKGEKEAYCYCEICGDIMAAERGCDTVQCQSCGTVYSIDINANDEIEFSRDYTQTNTGNKELIALDGNDDEFGEDGKSR